MLTNTQHSIPEGLLIGAVLLVVTVVMVATVGPAALETWEAMTRMPEILEGGR